MRKRELLERVRRNLGGTATREAAAYAFDAVMDSIKLGLRRDAAVRIAGFGTFLKRRRKARCVLRPGTREILQVPERDSVMFRPSSCLRRREGR
ncbi:MAG: HU family DNA-binding protein [Akkermansiaceae bacterium]|nr:HU family DNA-binding protein [Akkermansia sp.]MCD7799261.1 HU family DNA-binding protein [Akkermansiaceae bacterium]MCD8070823.1 HU family DNA-binding protein [Akkermansiaceae bacterium]